MEGILFPVAPGQVPAKFQAAFDDFYGKHQEMIAIAAYDGYMGGHGQGLLFASWDGVIDINTIFNLPESHQMKLKYGFNGLEIITPLIYVGDRTLPQVLEHIYKGAPTARQNMKRFYDPRDSAVIVVCFENEKGGLSFFSRMSKLPPKELPNLWKKKRHILEEFMVIDHNPNKGGKDA